MMELTVLEMRATKMVRALKFLKVSPPISSAFWCWHFGNYIFICTTRSATWITILLDVNFCCL